MIADPYDYIRDTIAVRSEILDIMQPYWSDYSLGRKQVMTQVGSKEKYLYFVLEGVQRAYIEKGDKESTLVFTYPPSFSGVVDSLLLQHPSHYCLETITASKFLRIHYNDLIRFINEYRELESWIRIALTDVLSGTLQRNIELLSYSAEERFKTLLQRSPHVLNMIPHKYLASYIGVDATTFSKLLSRIKV